MKRRKTSLSKIVMTTTLYIIVAGLALTGCATKKYVNEKVAASDQMTTTKVGEVQSSVENNQKAISDLQAKDKQLEEQIAKLSETAKDALARANEAGKLAEGTFVAEVILWSVGTCWVTDNYEKYQPDARVMEKVANINTKLKLMTTSKILSTFKPK